MPNFDSCKFLWASCRNFFLDRFLGWPSNSIPGHSSKLMGMGYFIFCIPSEPLLLLQLFLYLTNVFPGLWVSSIAWLWVLSETLIYMTNWIIDRLLWGYWFLFIFKLIFIWFLFIENSERWLKLWGHLSAWSLDLLENRIFWAITHRLDYNFRNHDLLLLRNWFYFCEVVILLKFADNFDDQVC